MVMYLKKLIGICVESAVL